MTNEQKLAMLEEMMELDEGVLSENTDLSNLNVRVFKYIKNKGESVSLNWDKQYNGCPQIDWIY